MCGEALLESQAPVLTSGRNEGGLKREKCCCADVGLFILP